MSWKALAPILVLFVSSEVAAFSVTQGTLTQSPTRPLTPGNPVAAELLSLLQDKASGAPTSDEKINELARMLILSKSTFDPDVSIDGPFYATCHFIGRTPLWEKIGFAKKSNLKGQKYTLGGADEENTVVNYSEILGDTVNLQATGTFVAIGPPSLEGDQKDTSTRNRFEMFGSIFSRNGKKERRRGKKSNLLMCPYDYAVTVKGASINILGNSFKIPIEGLGCTRVLYADECLRIFVSPDDTTVTSGGGDWESAGLIVVQVRIDLIDSKWVDRLQ